ncbi:hypothetical protein BJV82DRAFT_588234 [Fennellomyces sp. T-0311]|nr:hypothetical protein BJV82DRAFT_588234 [Fennellomyces sp. T-0311]
MSQKHRAVAYLVCLFTSFNHNVYLMDRAILSHGTLTFHWGDAFMEGSRTESLCIENVPPCKCCIQYDNYQWRTKKGAYCT